MPLRLAALGCALTLVVVLVLLPFQGHGWGYRYLHGYIGVLALLAAQAWVELVPPERARLPQSWTAMCTAIVYVLAIQFPLQALQVHDYLAPLVRAVAAIESADAGIVVVDDRGIYGEDLIRNDPFLRKAPITLTLSKLQDEQIEKLCMLSARVALFDRNAPAASGIRAPDVGLGSPTIEHRKALVQALPCSVRLTAR